MITILQATQPAGPNRCHSQQCLQETQLPEATARAAAEAQPAPAYPFFHADPRRTLRRASSRLAGLLQPRRVDLAAPQQPSPACCSPERSVLGSCCSAGRRLLLDEPCSSRQASPRQSAWQQPTATPANCRCLRQLTPSEWCSDSTKQRSPARQQRATVAAAAGSDGPDLTAAGAVACCSSYTSPSSGSASSGDLLRWSLLCPLLLRSRLRSLLRSLLRSRLWRLLFL